MHPPQRGAPMRLIAGGPALAPFGTRSFRFQWPADLCTAWALEMEVLILGWYVLVESGSVVQLTVFGALMYGGTLLSPLLGTLGDRGGLRHVLAAMRSSYALLAGVILHAGAQRQAQPVERAGRGVSGRVDQAVGHRAAFGAGRLTVPAVHLVAAMSIARTTQDSARIGGALAGAGFMASLGMASAYGVIVMLYLTGVVLTLRSASPASGAEAAPASQEGAAPAPRPMPIAAAPASPWRDLLEGLQLRLEHAAPARGDVAGRAGEPVRISAQRRADALHRTRRVRDWTSRAWAGWWPASRPAR